MMQQDHGFRDEVEKNCTSYLMHID